MLVKEEGNLATEREEQKAKAELSILVTDSGISMVTNASKYRKAEEPMLTTPFAKFTLERELHDMKESSTDTQLIILKKVE